MAGNAILINFDRGQIDTPDATGDVSFPVDADFLIATVDLYDNGSTIITVQLDFATYAGLEAEFVAGTSTAVLQAALTTHLNNVDLGLIDGLTMNQKSLIGYNIMIS